MEIDTLKGRLKLSPPLRTPIIISSSSSSPIGGTSLGDWVRTPGSSVILPSSGVPVFDRTPPVHSLGKPPRPTKTASKGKLVKNIPSLNLTDDGSDEVVTNSGAMLGNDKGAVATQEPTSRQYVDEAILYYAMDIMSQKRMYCGSGHLSSDGERVFCQFILHFKMVNMFLELLYQKTTVCTSIRKRWRYSSSFGVGLLRRHYVCKIDREIDCFSSQYFCTSKELVGLHKYILPVKSHNHWHLLELDFSIIQFNHMIQFVGLMLIQQT